MSDGIIIFGLTVWSIFGVIVLFNADIMKVKFSWKTFLVLGPILCVGFLIVGGVHAFAQKIAKWLET